MPSPQDDEDEDEIIAMREIERRAAQGGSTRFSTLGILLPDEVAAALKVSASTLAQWRTSNQGPLFVRVGRRVYYRVDDVKDWLGRNIEERKS